MKIAKDNQFIPNRQSVARILEQYGLELKAYSAAASGIENITLIADTSKGKFVVRVYRQHKKGSTEIFRELDFMEYLRTHMVKVPMIITNTEGSRLASAQFGGKTWQIIVMEFVEGRHASIYTDALLADLASTQARMHILSSTYKDAYAGPELLTRLTENYFITQIPQTLITDDALPAFLDRAKAYELHLPPELPHGLCHLDYDSNNVLVKDNTIAAVLDFDDLALAPFVVCLSYTLWHVYTHAGESAAQTYLRHYAAHRKLSDLELQYLAPTMLFRHYVLSAIAILSGRTSPEKIAAFIRHEAALGQKPGIRT